MDFLRRLLGGSEGTGPGAAVDDLDRDAEGLLVASEATFDATADRQRVTVWLRLHDAGFEDEREQQQVFRLENEVMRALDRSGAGEHDTNTLEGGYFAMRLVGDDADAIVDVVSPLLRDAPPGSYLALRRGGATTGEERTEIIGEERTEITNEP